MLACKGFNIKRITNEELTLFEKLRAERTEDYKVFSKQDYKGFFNAIVEKYPESAHFIYEMLQNADDVEATEVRIHLYKDRLHFCHNGRIGFSISSVGAKEQGHINAITAVGNSTKTDKENKIGKFGVGFKAVFQYTKAPEIYDDKFRFRIINYIIPESIGNDHPKRRNGETLFVFPFFNPKSAYEDIQSRLKSLDNPILFLRHLRKIEWTDEANPGITHYYEKTVEPIIKADGIDCNLVTSTEGRKQNKIIMFSKKVDLGEHGVHDISLGYYLTDDGRINTEIRPNIFCFFPTSQKFDLCFVSHAPFLLIDSRQQMKETDETNKKLVQNLAEMAGQSLIFLARMSENKDVPYLDDNIFDIIPLTKPYRPYYEAPKLTSVERFYEEYQKTIKAFPVLYSRNKTYVHVSKAVVCTPVTMLNVFDSNQLSQLLNRDDMDFLAQKICANVYKSDSLVQYLKDLGVRHLTSMGLIEYLVPTFLNKQPHDAKSDSIKTVNDSIQRAYEKLNISEKNLTKSNADLKESNIRLAEERDNVLKANWKMMENQALAVAEKAKQKIADGEVYAAMLALLEVLPEDKTSKVRAYVPEAEAALRMALDSIRGTSWKKQALAENIEYYFSANDKYLLSIQQEDSVTITMNLTNTETLQDMCNIKLPINYSYISCSDNDNFICVGTSSEIMVYDTQNGKLVSWGGLNDSMAHRVIQNYTPVYIETSLFLPNDKCYTPNILTNYFKPEDTTLNIEVIDYSSLRKWILYKKVEQIYPDEQDFFIESYKLYDIFKRSTLWEISDTTIIPTNVNDVSLSRNGNFVAVTHPGSLDIYDLTDNTFKTIDTSGDSDHYSNHSVITKDEKYIFQHSDFTAAHIYDIQTCICIDSIPNFPLLPYSPSFTQNGSTFVINFYDGVECIRKPFLFTKTNNMHLTQPKDIKSSLIRKNINNYVTNRLNTDNSYVLYYDDNRNIKWECMDAKFIGYTSDMEYVAVVKDGMRGYLECQVLEKNSGICMYSESPEYPQDEIFRFLSYGDLLNTCKKIVRYLKMTESTRKSYYL